MKKWTLVFVNLFVFIAFTSYAFAAGVTLAWNPPSSGGVVKGYNIYYGNSNGNYPNKVEGITSTQYVVSGLDEGKVYYFIVKAYNDAGESGPSNVKSWMYSDTTPPLPPDGVNVN
jgi:hypothetical protein